MGHAALHTQPTRYMCVYGVCVRGERVQYMFHKGGGIYGSSTVTDGESQRYMYVCINCKLN